MVSTSADRSAYRSLVKHGYCNMQTVHSDGKTFPMVAFNPNLLTFRPDGVLYHTFRNLFLAYSLYQSKLLNNIEMGIQALRKTLYLNQMSALKDLSCEGMCLPALKVLYSVCSAIIRAAVCTD